MTRKDYREIAKAVSNATEGDKLDRAAFLSELCSILKSDNSRFDKERFINACNQAR